MPSIENATIMDTNGNNGDGATAVVVHDHTAGNAIVFVVADARSNTEAAINSVVSDLDGALDFITAVQNPHPTFAGGGRIALYLLDDPTVDEHEITITYSVAVGSTAKGAQAYSISNFDGFRDITTDQADGDNASVSAIVDSGVGDLILDFCRWRNSSGVATLGGSQTLELTDSAPTRQFSSSKTAGDPTTTMSADVDDGSDANRVAYMVVSVAGPAADLPEAPTLDVQATSWDAAHFEVQSGADTDEVDVRISDTPGVTESDTLLTNFDGEPPDGEGFAESLDPNTTYFLRAFAKNAEGATPSAEQSVTTWSDNAIETFTDDDPIQIPFELPADQQATELRLKAGTAIRSVAALGFTGGLHVLVEDEQENVVGEETFPNLPNQPDTELTELSVPLSPGPEGPQTLQVTFTASIDE